MKRIIPSFVTIAPVLLTAVASESAAAQLQRDPAQIVQTPLDPVALDLAGVPLPAYPHFQLARTFYEGTDVWAAVDPFQVPALVGGTYMLYVTAHQSPGQWEQNGALVDVAGGPVPLTVDPTSIAGNVVTVDTGTLSGDAGLELGVGYDVVLDVDGDGQLSDADLIDGFGAEPGFFVARDPLASGPLAVTEVSYFVTGVKVGFEGQNTFYPTNIASMGQLPLVIVSHGNGHNYNWYDHIGTHLASWGYVVMSHENDTQPGVNSASLTTLDHTDAFIGQLASIAGGVLDGHVDTSRIVWIGHSRGGEGIVIAYDRLFDGNYVPQFYSISDIVGLSSIAPTVFNGTADSTPHGVPYHLWTGASDSDVSGCAGSPVTHTFLLHERATGDHFSVYLHGAGHGVFHNGTGGTFATGPCLISRPRCHEIMRGQLLPLVQHFMSGNLAAQDFLWRQYEAFAPPSLTPDPCVVSSMTYQRRTQPRLVIDDFETNSSDTLSSSGGQVSWILTDLTEGNLDDPDSNFTQSAGEPMNGMNYHGGGGASRGIVLGYRVDGHEIEWEVVPGSRDVSQWKWLSLRAGQSTRAPATALLVGDTTFTIELRDELGATSEINIGTYGGGLAEPYQRGGCGLGNGWSNFFETIRIRVSDFEADGSGIDLTRVEAVRLLFGPSFGTAQGSLGLDDLEFVNE